MTMAAHRTLFLLALTTLTASVAHADMTTLFQEGGTEALSCSYKGKIASRPCTVSVQFHHISASQAIQSIDIHWPDGDTSNYSWNCIQDRCRLQKTSETGNPASYSTRFFPSEYMIRRNGREWVRVW